MIPPVIFPARREDVVVPQKHDSNYYYNGCFGGVNLSPSLFKMIITRYNYLNEVADYPDQIVQVSIKKNNMAKTFWLIGLVIVAGAVVFVGCGERANQATQQTVDTLTGIDKVQTGQRAEKDLAVAQCQTLWQQKFSVGEDLSSGPCLADVITTDWSCDVAHSPRTAVDDQSANQCAAYKRGETHHFVELDTSGKLINAQ